MDEVLHLRNPGRIRFPNVNGNKPYGFNPSFISVVRGVDFAFPSKVPTGRSPVRGDVRGLWLRGPLRRFSAWGDLAKLENHRYSLQIEF